MLAGMLTAVTLLNAVRKTHPELAEPEQAILAGHVLVNGLPVRNPRSLVGTATPISLAGPAALRGEAKLGGALAAFPVTVEGRIALDAGAAAGGFTRVLLAHGARRVYAVDAGHGQLLGSLRQDSRVVNLEGTNLGALNPALVPDTVGVITLDLSYLSLANAVPQLRALNLARDADLITLVKPMFELALDHAPSEQPLLDRALEQACAGIEAAGWQVRCHIASPVTGAKGAHEWLVWAQLSDP
ncbi:MAG: TlyA family rRNA (cytidine-2'-O)-methyltransferase [Chloroflexi bacterium]|nr:TlyA family rRNA (cytidine-2'-O)-methyltransferase [Chloroflexota bacterium]